MRGGSRQRILGAVLAGGRARRFGGDKALALLHGRPLIEHAAEALARHAAVVVICGRSHAPYAALADLPGADMGPLGGLNAALHHAAAEGYEGVLCTGCDMPVFPDALAMALIGEGAAIVERQYLMSYWPSALAPKLDAYLRESSDRSVRGWLAAVGPRQVAAPPLPNINTPEDLVQLENDS
jgi:molybdopterin-guanine dinucleotide biosynthesis protein A